MSPRTTTECYLRIGKGANGVKVDASRKSNPAALAETVAGIIKPIPTIQLKLKMNLPLTAFMPSAFGISVEEHQLELCTDIEVTEP